MPELPEVETIKRGLAPHLEGKRIFDVRLNRLDLRFPLPVDMAKRLKNARFLPLQRRAKYLLLPLDLGETLIIHLGMSGRLLIETAAEAQQMATFHHSISRHVAHDHVILTLEDGQRLIYNDPRRFGYMLLVISDRVIEYQALAQLGYEPLSNEWNVENLLLSLQGKRVPLKSALLDQRIIAGLGNIYVCEALHHAALSPYRLASNLTHNEAERLVIAIRVILRAAIEAGGSTLRDYRQGDGTLGYFQHDFQVYGQEGHSCRRMGCTGVIERQVQAGRSTFFCATCQK